MPERLPRVASLLKLALLAGAIAVPLLRIRAPIDGEHYFRQTHVASNIEKFVSGGLSLRPATYNVDAPLALFDFPAYELTVAFLSRTLGTPPLETARALNLVFFALSFVMANSLLRRTGVSPVASFVTLLVFALSPLSLYYVGAPIPDILAVSFSLVSLTALVSWELSGEVGFPLVFCLAGIVATLVKNPVYLSVACAVPTFLYARGGRPALQKPAVLAWALLIASSVVAFKVYSNTVNHVSVFLTSDESGQYFGDLSQRLDPWRWGGVLGNAAKAATPVGLALSAFGILVLASRAGIPHRALYLGLGAGAFVTLLTFFSRFTWHDYYHLAFVFPLAALAGFGADALSALAKRPATRFGILALLVAGIASFSAVAYARFFSGIKAGQTTRAIRVAGAYVRGGTEPGDFVVYVIDDHENWNPAYLYFASRDGFNLHLHSLSRKSLVQIRSVYAQRRPVVVFCPASFSRICRARLKIPPQGASADAPGFLYTTPENEEGPW
jgi:hypothetical protein